MKWKQRRHNRLVRTKSGKRLRTINPNLWKGAKYKRDDKSYRDSNTGVVYKNGKKVGFEPRKGNVYGSDYHRKIPQNLK